MVNALCRSVLLALSVYGATLPGVAMARPEATGTPDRHRYTNRLIHSSDPYLLLHAHNPVDWYPWGPEALARAKKEDKPIFLSIGYSTCYWCHVAEKLLYSRPEIAALMNPWFVNIKVDREQRPDLDRVYMLATQLMTGHGGWPNNVFLTPDLKPFYGGSYFGPTDGDLGRPGFPTVLTKIHEAWTSDRTRVITTADRVYQAMREVQAEARRGRAAAVRPADWIARGRQELARSFDRAYGGFAGGNGTKFPQAPMLELLLADYRGTHSAESLAMLRAALDAMALGGVYDQLAGGFHRYSTEPTWSVPHFEKMLYDNAQLLSLYADAYEITQSPLYRSVAGGVIGYLEGQMFDPAGGFYSAQDAEVGGVEGASYVWTRAEIVSLLGAEGTRGLFEVYELTPMPPGREAPTSGERPGVLRVRAALAPPPGEAGALMERLDALAPLRARLLAARTRRPQPLRDEKIMVSANGLAIAAFVRAGQVFQRERQIQLARRTAERIWTLAYDGRAHRLEHEIFRGHAQTDGYLDDYALLGGGFMALAEATGETVWRERATTLADDIVRRFLHADGRLATTPHERALLVPPVDDGDGVAPSGTSATVDLLLRVSAATGAARHAAVADRVIRYVGGAVQEHPALWGTLVAGVGRHGAPIETRVASDAPRGPRSAPPGTGADRLALPATTDHVRVSATAATAGDHDEIVTTLQVDPGWHVNANPASFDYLIPTSVAFEGLAPVRVVFPKAVRIRPKFAPDGLDVYEGTARLVAVFPKGALERAAGIRGTVTTQACSDEVCLPPAKIPVVPDGPDGQASR
jgi:hypothetical protein